ncbi:GNAT family N-acetyltransferase [Candidatus Saccharibacteria bacterium]|nr:GNAT family N-acetyltransferase [Candidatus Saccharibacteria bacterium]
MNITQVTQKTPEFETFEKQQWSVQDTEHFGHDINWDKAPYLLQAEDKGKIVGILDMNIKGGVAKIEGLLVDQNRHRQGIGKQLVVEAEHIAKEAGAHKMYLITGKTWQASRFYQAMGYEPEGMLKRHHQGEDWIQFSKFF